MSFDTTTVPALLVIDQELKKFKRERERESSQHQIHPSIGNCNSVKNYLTS